MPTETKQPEKWGSLEIAEYIAGKRAMPDRDTPPLRGKNEIGD